MSSFFPMKWEEGGGEEEEEKEGGLEEEDEEVWEISSSDMLLTSYGRFPGMNKNKVQIL